MNGNEDVVSSKEDCSSVGLRLLLLLLLLLEMLGSGVDAGGTPTLYMISGVVTPGT